VLLTVVSFAQTPGTTRKVWSDSLFIKSSPTTYSEFYDILTDSLNNLSASNGIVYSGRDFGQKIVKDTTTAKAYKPDSSGTTIFIAQEYVGGLFRYYSSGSAKRGIDYAVTGGGIWHRVEADRKIWDIRWFGAKPGSTSYATANREAMQAALNSAWGGNTDTAMVYIPDANGIWYIDDSLRVPGGASQRKGLKIFGGSNSIIQITADNKTVISVPSFSQRLMIEDLHIRGYGKNSNTYGLKIKGAVANTIHLNRVRIDSCGVGFWPYDVTNLSADNLFIWYNRVGVDVSYQADAHAYRNANFSFNDTAIVISGTSASGVLFESCNFTYNDSLVFYQNHSGDITIQNCYFEGNLRHGYVNVPVGEGTTSWALIKNSGLINFGANAEYGFWFVSDANVVFISNVMSGGCDTSFVLFSDTNPKAVFFGNIISGTNAQVQYRNANNIFNINNFLTFGMRQETIFDANRLTANSSIDAFQDYSFYTTFNKYLTTWRTKGIANHDSTATNLAWVKTDAAGSGQMGVGVNGTMVIGGDTLTTSEAVLELISISRGFLQPRMSTTSRNNNITAPVAGLSIYNNSVNRHQMHNGTQWLDLFAGTNGVNAFATTATTDTIAVTGLTTNSIVFVQQMGTGYNVNDILRVERQTDQLIVHRNAGGTSGLQYSWAWIKE